LTQEPESPVDPDEFEEELAQCLERYHGQGAAALQGYLDAHPLGARLRARLSDLERLGLLGGGDDLGGRRLGPYRLLRRIGQGGMSEVFLAHDERMERDVALKSAHPGLALDERGKERFAREVRAVAQLSHAGIVPVFDQGEAEGRAFFTMEYVPGVTLGELLDAARREGTPPEELTGASLARLAGVPADDQGEQSGTHLRWRRSHVELAARWTLEVAEALEHAHENGIVHRDIKPSNIMLRPEGRAQLFDFGLARLEDQPSLTRSGDFTGTPYYVSPEQLSQGADAVDARSDVYSLGATLYELLTLRRPFEGASTAEVLHKIQTREPRSPRHLHGRLPRDIERVCLTALDKNRTRRYADMSAFAADLRRFLDFEPVLARPLGPLQRAVRFLERRPALGAALALGLVIIIGLPTGLLLANAAIRDQRDQALLAAAEERRANVVSDQVVDFLMHLFEIAQEDTSDMSARQLLETGLARIPTGAEQEPLVRGVMLATAGRVYANLGLHARAVPFFNRAYAILRNELSDEDPRVNEILHDLARAQLEGGVLESARTIGQAGLAGFDAAGLSEDPRTADMLQTLAAVYLRLDELAEAEACLVRAISIERAVQASLPEGERTRVLSPLAPPHGELRIASVHGQLAAVHTAAAEPQRARERLERALAIYEAAWTPEPEAERELRSAYVRVLRDLGQEALAADEESRIAELRSRALAWREHELDPLPELAFVFDSDARRQYDEHFNAGILGLQSGRGDAARASFLACLEIAPREAVCAYNIACACSNMGDVADGLAWLQRALDWGYVRTVSERESISKDKDLAGLRSDPRFAELEAQAWAVPLVGEGVQQALVQLPEPRPQDGPLPVALLLTGDGGPKPLLEGAVGEALQAAGWVAIAPRSPGVRARWFLDLQDLEERQDVLARAVLAGLESLPADVERDPARTWIIATREGAPLAVALALRFPGLLRGLLLLDGPPSANTLRPAARTAALSGLAVEVVLRLDRDAAWGREGVTAVDRLWSLVDWFQSLTLSVHGSLVEDEEALRVHLLERLAR